MRWKIGKWLSKLKLNEIHQKMWRKNYGGSSTYDPSWCEEFYKFLLELPSGASLTVDRLKLSNIEIKYKYEKNSEFKTKLSQRRNSTQYSEGEQAKVNNNNSSQPGFYLKFMFCWSWSCRIFYQGKRRRRCQI